MHPRWRVSSAALTLGVLAAAFLPSPVRAQSATPTPDAPPQTRQVPPSFRTEVIVTPDRAADDRQRVPAATALLSRDEIDRLPAPALSDVVQALPGFQMLFASGSSGTPAAISRGFFGGGEAEYVKLLVDGIPVGDAESGVGDWRHIPAFALDRIEAVRGPASAVYGDTALAGVIQVFTSVVNRRVARAELAAGTSSSRSIHAQAGHPIGAGAVGVLASYDDTNGFRQHSANQQGFASLSWLRRSDPRQWSVRGSYGTLQHEEPGPLNAEQIAASRTMADPMFRHDRQESRRGYGAVRFAAQAAIFRTSTIAHAAIRDVARLRTLLLAPGFGDPMHRDLSTTEVGASTENSLDTRVGNVSGQLRFGGDVARSDLDTTYRILGDGGSVGDAVASLRGRRWATGVYAAQTVDAGSRVRLQAGIRWDGLDDRVHGQTAATHNAWTPRAGVTFLIAPASRPVTLFAQVSRAFKAATLDQLYDPRPLPDFQGGTFRVSNPGLRPQRASNFEAGLRQAAAGFRWEAVAYHMQVRDEIDFDPATFTYGNIGRSTHQGVELDGRTSPHGFLSIGGQYTWTRVVPRGSLAARGQLKNIPRHLFRPDLTLSPPGGWLLHAIYTRTLGTYADDQNTIALRDRSTIDLRIAKRFEHIVFRVDLFNVGNHRYEEVGFTLPDFGGNLVPFYFPAPGSAVRAGVELKF